MSSEGGTLEDTLSDESSGIKESLQRQEQIGSLEECMELLASGEKYFIEMHLRRGMNLSMLAEHLRKSRAALEMYKTRLIARLRKCFKKKGYAVA